MKTCLEPVRCAPMVQWVKDERCTVVVNGEGQLAFRLSGLAEFLWHSLLQHRPPSEMVAHTARFEQLSPALAAERLYAILREWQSLGLIEPLEGQEGERG
jgi:hypothetical protein